MKGLVLLTCALMVSCGPELKKKPRADLHTEAVYAFLGSKGEVNILYTNAHEAPVVLDTYPFDYVVRKKTEDQSSYSDYPKVRLQLDSDWAVVPPGTSVLFQVHAWENKAIKPIENASAVVIEADPSTEVPHLLQGLHYSSAAADFPKILEIREQMPSS